MANITSSLIQPLFGYLADKTARRWILPLSVLLSSLGLGLPRAGAVVLGGAGPGDGHRVRRGLVSSRRAIAPPPRWRAIARPPACPSSPPAAISGSRSARPWPPRSSPGSGCPAPSACWCRGVVIALLLTAVLPSAVRAGAVRSRARRPAPAAPRPWWRAMSLLILVVAIRSWTQLGFTTFMPFYWKEVLHGDPRHVGTLLAVFLGAGVVGTLGGGAGGRPHRRRAATWWRSSSSPPRWRWAFSSWRAGSCYVLLGVLGFVLVSTFTVSVVLGQAYLPKNPGSGLRPHRGLRHRRRRARRQRARAGWPTTGASRARCGSRPSCRWPASSPPCSSRSPGRR